MSTEKNYHIHETLTYSDYYTPREYPSQIDKSKTVVDYEHGLLGCPRCHVTGMDNIPHGGSATCPNCGLYMERYGNALEAYTD